MRAGYHLASKFLCQQDVDQLCSEWSHLYRMNLSGPEFSVDVVPQDSPFLSGLLKNPQLINLFSEIRSGPVWFFSAKLFDKSPSNNLNVPWHQSINPLITIWIPLDPVSSKNGCLTVKPGFNKTLLPQLRDGTIDWSASGQTQDEFEIDSIDINMNPGDILLFDDQLAHSSKPNQTQFSRRVLIVRFAPQGWRPDVQALMDSDKRIQALKCFWAGYSYYRISPEEQQRLDEIEAEKKRRQSDENSLKAEIVNIWSRLSVLKPYPHIIELILMFIERDTDYMLIERQQLEIRAKHRAILPYCRDLTGKEFLAFFVESFRARKHWNFNAESLKCRPKQEGLTSKVVCFSYQWTDSEWIVKGPSDDPGLEKIMQPLYNRETYFYSNVLQFLKSFKSY